MRRTGQIDQKDDWLASVKELQMQFEAFKPGILHIFLKDLSTVYIAHYRDTMVSHFSC